VRRRLAIAATAALLLGPSASARDPAGPQVVAEVRPSVARVQARDCDDGGGRNASGFLYETSERVVTALHVVAGCRSLHAYFEESQTTIPAEVVHSSARSDLAILRLERAAATQPLAISPDRLQPGDRMVAVGYAVGQTTKSDFHLRVASGGNRLRDTLNDTAFRQVRNAGTPALDLEILRIHGHLLPGLSGAPIIDERGRVVGIGDGGLEQGTVSLGWGVPAAEIAALAAQPPTTTPAVARAAPSLFAAEVRATTAPASAAEPASEVLACGDRRFRMLRTRPFSALAQGSDSPLMVQQFLGALAQAGIDPSGFSYDIYVEEATGAAIAIPAGWEVERDDDEGWCAAEAPDGLTEMAFTGLSVANIPDAVAKSTEFENALTGYGLFQGQLDANWSYVQPFFRPDGLIVNRKSVVLVPTNSLSGLTPAYAIETLLARDDLFVGVVAVDGSLCRFNPYAPGCDPTRPVPIEYVQAALGSALSTMPCGPNVDNSVLNQLAGQSMQAWPNALCTGN